jgi:hypothetical protein
MSKDFKPRAIPVKIKSFRELLRSRGQWMEQMAEAEDGCDVSVGGNTDIEDRDAAQDQWFYIMHRGCSGNCAFWWRPKGSGYTCDLAEAWILSEEEAKKICRSRPKEDFPVPRAIAIKAACQHVDVNLVWSMGYGKWND